MYKFRVLPVLEGRAAEYFYELQEKMANTDPGFDVKKQERLLRMYWSVVVKENQKEMAFLNECCEFDELTATLHGSSVGLDCKKEQKIQTFFRNECLDSDKQMLSHTYCFYEEVGLDNGAKEKRSVVTHFS